MIINGESLLKAAPIKNMLGTKETNGEVSHGLSEAGYDIRIKQGIFFLAPGSYKYIPVMEEKEEGSNKVGFKRKFIEFPTVVVVADGKVDEYENTRFVLASAVEEFDMPNNLVGIVHDKSSWARQGLSVFNTVIEPDWKGYLTLELVFHGNQDVHIKAGSGIAQVIFHDLTNSGSYAGKYQNQPNMPVKAIHQ